MKIRFTYLSLLLVMVQGAQAEIRDTLFSKQWALKNSGQVILKNISELERFQSVGLPGMDINWLDTSEQVTPKKELIVAVIDSGIDLDHQDLKNRIWYNEKLCLNAPNAKNLPCFGYNFLDNNTNLTDEVGHGTHVAGVIAANRNDFGIMGAADSRIKIMPLKVINNSINGFVYNGKLITDVIADAMIFAIKNGAEVINLSLGWPKLIDTAKVRQAFQMAEEQNVFVVAASGNNTKDLPTFPCAYESVVCVGAIDNRGLLTDFTNFGAKVDVVAPGEYIVSTLPKNLESRTLRIKNYEVKRGSSQAAPYVSAAVATLKLLNPGLNNDQVRSRLFRSSKELLEQKSKKSIKFGMLDFSQLLSIDKEQEIQMAIPLVKSLTEIKFKAIDNRFIFNLPIKNLSTKSMDIKICLDIDMNWAVLDQSCFDFFQVGAQSINTIKVSGELKNLALDSHVNLKILVNDKKYDVNLVFSRDLNGDSQLIQKTIAGASFEDMAFISPDRKLSRMGKIFDKYKLLNYPEYFYLEKSKQSEASTVVSVLTNRDDNFLVKSFTLPKVNKVLSIHRQDINFDGKPDYFVYTLSAKKDELHFFLFDNDLNPLFGKYSKWIMPLSTFEGLPIDSNVEKFEWLKVLNSKLGKILVPSIFKAYAMPEEDNSKNILDRVTGVRAHQFYFNPKINEATDSMMIELRVIDTVSILKSLRKNFNLYDDQEINLLKPIPQTKMDIDLGQIRSLATLYDGTKVKYLSLVLVEGKITVEYLANAFGLDQALMYPLLDITTGEFSSETVLTTLLNRASAEFIIKSHLQLSAPLVIRKEWENPIMGLIGSFDSSDGKKFFIENRSSVTLLKENGTKSELPIYRDSSFPGQNFSETLSPVIADGHSGIYVNSTLIYGERVYSMIDSDLGFVRPLGLSVNIPSGCVVLNPENINNNKAHSYLFLCTDASKQVTLKILPLSL